jgi:tat pathway signal sequence domain protein
VVAVAGAGGGGAQFATLASHFAVFSEAPDDQLNPAMRIAADGAGTAIGGGNAGADASQDNDGQGGMLMARPYQTLHPVTTWDEDMDLRISVTGGTPGRAGVPGTTGEALIGVLGADRQLTLKDMKTPWFENVEFPPYYSYDGDSVVTGVKGTGGSEATSGYKGRGGSGALIAHDQDRFSLTSIASGGGAGYGGGGAALNIWTAATYFDDVFGRQVQFNEGGSITSVTAMSSGGGAGGSYINHELVSDFSLSTAKNANSQVGVRSPGSVQLYNCSENASLASPITGEAA